MLSLHVGELVDTEQYPIRMRPQTSVRVNNVAGGLVIAGAAGVMALIGLIVPTVPVAGAWTLGLIFPPFSLYGLLMSGLSLRLKLTLTENTAIVRGYFGTTRVPRESISEVTEWPTLLWTDATDRHRRTFVNALNIYRSGRARPNPAIQARADADANFVREWAEILPGQRRSGTAQFVGDGADADLDFGERGAEWGEAETDAGGSTEVGKHSAHPQSRHKLRE